MKEILFVTTNNGKVVSLQKRLDESQFKIKQIELDLPELQGDSSKDISLEKAKAAFKIVGKPLIVQDSSFHIRSLNGFPGAYIKYILKTIGLKGILKLLEGVEDRSAYAEGALTYIEDVEHFWTFTNQSSDSTIALEIRDGNQEESWSELWKILIPNGFDKTYSELTKDELDAKQKSSKSTSEFRQFAEWLTIVKLDRKVSQPINSKIIKDEDSANK